MRTIPASLAAHLVGGATTLATCWKLVRPDGVGLGFTDHDRDLVFDGLTYAAASGLEASDVEAQLGFAVTGLEVTGALSALSITERDIEAGLYDGASVETWLVNWADVAQRVKIGQGFIGEIRRIEGAFTAEIRSVLRGLDQTQGRVYGRTCDAVLGDARCTVDLAAPNRQASATVVSTDGRLRVSASGLTAFATGQFDQGLLRWTGGAKAGARVEIRRHRLEDGLAVFDLWRAMADPIAIGDPFVVTVGCDKRFATCRDRFLNQRNFRGFPHIPGNDRTLATAQAGASNRGGSLFA
jgi:uncharacterized phage protein (TIGR02218 family)